MLAAQQKAAEAAATNAANAAAAAAAAASATATAPGGGGTGTVAPSQTEGSQGNTAEASSQPPAQSPFQSQSQPQLPQTPQGGLQVSQSQYQVGEQPGATPRRENGHGADQSQATPAESSQVLPEHPSQSQQSQAQQSSQGESTGEARAQQAQPEEVPEPPSTTDDLFKAFEGLQNSTGQVESGLDSASHLGLDAFDFDVSFL